MKKYYVTIFFLLIGLNMISAQKIISMEYNGHKYEVLDLTSKGKIMWGGYEEIAADAAKSETNGTINTKAIVIAVGKNSGFENKSYAAKLCDEATDGGKSDWFLPSKSEADAIYSFKEKFTVEERGNIWTSTEANGTQAVTKYWYNGTFYNNQKVEEYYVLCIRKAD